MSLCSRDFLSHHYIFSKSHITCAMVLFIPKTRLHTRQFPTWFTPQLRHSRKCLRTLQRKFNKNPSTSNHQRLSKAQQFFHAANIAAKSTHEQNLIYNLATSKDPKIFHFIKEFTKTHVLPSQLHTDSTSVETDVDKAELFNQYFYSVFTRSDFPMPDPMQARSQKIHLGGSFGRKVDSSIIQQQPQRTQLSYIVRA